MSTRIAKLNESPWLNSSPLSASTSSLDDDNDTIKQRPRYELMNRLSDALSLLPREIQELIVDRLIQAITSPKEIQSCLNVTNALKEVAIAAAAAGSGGTDLPVSSTVPQSPKNNNN